MPTVQTRPWSTQYKDTYKSNKKPKRVTIKATPITYPITPNHQIWSVQRPVTAPLPHRPTENGPIGVQQPRIHTEVDTDHHWSDWPGSRVIDVNNHPTVRPYSSPGIHRVPTLFQSGPADIEDRPDTVQPSYVFGDTELLEKGSALTFVPELNSWVTNATSDYEKNAARKVSETMQRGMNTFQRSRSVSPMRTRPYFGRSLTQAEGFDYPTSYSQSWNPYGAMASMPTNDRYMVRHLEGATPLANYSMYPQSARESRPMTRHLRRGSLNQGYVHDLSCFQSTQPMVTGHFVIHPDWVSERLVPRRKAARKSQIQY